MRLCTIPRLLSMRYVLGECRVVRGFCITSTCNTASHDSADVSSSHDTSSLDTSSHDTASHHSHEQSPSNSSFEAAPDIERAVGKLPNDQSLRLKLKANQPRESKLLRVAIIGTPNSGKSTLTNQLLGWKVFAVSSKVHTTRENTLGVYTHGNTQLVFLDTPGIIPLQAARRVKLGRAMLTDPHASLSHADIVGVIVDISKRWNRSELDGEILKVLHLNPNIPAILILNKVDDLKDKTSLLSTVRTLTDGIVQGAVFHSTKSSRGETKTNVKQMLQRLESSQNADKISDVGLLDNVQIHNRSHNIYSNNLDKMIVDDSDKIHTVDQDIYTNNLKNMSDDECELSDKTNCRDNHSNNVENSSDDNYEIQRDDQDIYLNNFENMSDSESENIVETSDDFLLNNLDGISASDTTNDSNCENSNTITQSESRTAILHRNSYKRWLENRLAGKGNEAFKVPGSDFDLRDEVRLLNKIVKDKRGWPHFKEVFMVSALTGDGVDRLRDYLVYQAQPQDWLYHSSLVTNQSPTQLAKRFVREKFMDRLPDEVPYNLKLDIVLWDVDEDTGLMKIVMDVVCHSQRYYALVLGHNGKTIQTVARDAKQELLNAFRTDMIFKLQAKLVAKDK